MGFVRYALWIVASFVLLAVWGAVGTLLLDLADSLLIRTTGPDTTPLWIAYAGMIFSAFVWPALLLLLTHNKKPLGRMLRGWVLAFAMVNVVVGLFVAVGIGGAEARMDWFGRDFSAAFDILLAGALYASSVAAVDVFCRRSSGPRAREVLGAGSV